MWSSCSYPLFQFLSPDVKSIATRSGRFNAEDAQFAKAEVAKLLSEGVTGQSESPWRAQSACHEWWKTQATDGCRLLANNKPKLISKSTTTPNRVGIVLLTWSRRYQTTIDPEDKIYIVFEANGKLLSDWRLPFSVSLSFCFSKDNYNNRSVNISIIWNELTRV